MSVSLVSSSSATPYQARLADAFRQRVEEFKALGNALQSGDLGGAQQAYASLKKDTQTIQIAQQQHSQPSRQISRLRPDFKAVESALNSGDLSAAQTAFATLQQDIQSLRKSHGGHDSHVHQAPALQSPTQNDDADSSNISTPSIGTYTNQSA